MMRRTTAHMARRATSGLLVALAVAISACGGTDETGDAPTQAATPTPTETGDASTSADAVAWAGGVCSATDALEQSLDALGTSLEVDLGSDEKVVDQLGPQVQAQADAVRADAAALTSALTALPDPADPDLEAAAQELQSDQQSLEESAAGLRDAASGLSEATDAASLAQGVAAVAAQFTIVQLDARTFADTIQTTAEQGAAAARAAFVEAPECDNRV